MSRNPNAVAAWVASHIIIAAQALCHTYLHRSLPPFWQQELAADTAAAVLYVGRSGIKGALARLVGTARIVWGGAKA